MILNESGKQLTSVGECVKTVTKSIIKRPITAHRFRNCMNSFFQEQELSDVEKEFMVLFTQHKEQTAKDIYGNKRLALSVAQRFHSWMK